MGDLIRKVHGGWDVNILKNLFSDYYVDYYVDEIVKIPPSKFRGMDRLIWSGSLDGNLDVKSAYFQARVLLRKPCPRRGFRCLKCGIVYVPLL